MEQRRFLTFVVLSMGIGFLWFNLLVPILFPDFNRRPVEGPADARYPVNRVLDIADDQKEEDTDKAVAAAKVPQFPDKTFLLGPADPDKVPDGPLKDKQDEFFLAAGVTSKGAAIDYVELTDKQRYPAFGRRGDRVRVLGDDEKETFKTFSLQCPVIDKQLGDSRLDKIAWEVVPEADPAAADRAVTFRFASPDGRWELIKHFELRQLTHEELAKPEIKKTFVEGYEIKLTIKVRNLSDEPRQLNYTLLGPVGIPLEDPENTSKYRDIRLGLVREDGRGLDESKMSATDTIKKIKQNNLEWKRKLEYLGVDVLYFAALVMPKPDQVESARPLLADLAEKPERSDLSVELKSIPLDVPAKGEISHEYTMFAGPKRKELMTQLSALAVMDYGWFDSICRGMVWLLNTFHGMGLSYGVAIICLTALVRTLLLPISKHQAANAAKMKVLQPKMMARQKELEAKYGKNTDEYMRAAQELSKEQLGLMMSGCLPVFLQLPIFIALYRAIGSSIELRMEPFLWFENLASPDALFALPFTVPWFGWKHFNLLPCISTGLMFVHQKLTMPPAANEEQAQQQKMMGYMMIFMGAMFFRVPSGLCLYFIATNIWSMTERWIFEHFKTETPEAGDPSDGVVVPSSSPKNVPPTPKNSPSSTPPTTGAPEKPSALGALWGRLQEAADNQHSASRQLENNSNRDDRNSKKKKKR